MATLPEPVANLDIKIVQGARFSITVTAKNGGVPWVGLTAGAITASIRKSFAEPTDLATFTIVPDGSDTSKFSIVLDGATSLLLQGPFTGSRTREVVIGVWNCKVLLAGVTYRLIQGNVTLSRGV